jgi:hypothetical protein
MEASSVRQLNILREIAGGMRVEEVPSVELSEFPEDLPEETQKGWRY